MKICKAISLRAAWLFCCLAIGFSEASGDVNSGSDGHDGAFNPSQNVIIDMGDHPDGIYQYTSVNIPSGVTVTFKPNANNTPVVWLVQGNCVISGIVSLIGSTGNSAPGIGGPGGFSGGNGGSLGSAGQGPGGGPFAVSFGGQVGGNASYGSMGLSGSSGYYVYGAAGSLYGNAFLIPLFGGSGGGGESVKPWYQGYISGAGGGGAILIAASGTITITGTMTCDGGAGAFAISTTGGGSGSGGSIRVLSSVFNGAGVLSANGGSSSYESVYYSIGGQGRIRIDAFQNNFTGSLIGVSTHGFQPIILPAAGQGVHLNIASVGGAVVSGSPSGVLANPDVIVSAQQTNPIPVVVNCSNLPLNTQITVTVHPANGADVTAVGLNNVGTLASSTATVSLNMPRGGGIIYAKCVSGVAGLSANAPGKELKAKSLADTGLTASGERFAKMEITAALGGKQQIAYITESGKRYSIP